MSTNDQHIPLRDDVRLLGNLLGMTVKQQAGEDIYDVIERIRGLAKLARNGDADAVQVISDLLQGLSVEELAPITKAFSQFLNFANIAEQYHRIRRAHWYKLDPTKEPQLGSLQHAVSSLLAQGVDKPSLYDAIMRLDLQFVLTSHPTEVKRRTVMRKYDRISAALHSLDEEILPPDEELAVKTAIAREMTAVWQTPEVSTEKPTAIEEAKWGFAIIESSMWHAIPLFMREFSKVVRQYLGQELPLDFMPIRIDSWLGGDRDGNPNVTPEVTRRVIYMARWVAADLLLNEIRILHDSLSMQPCNAKLRSLVGDVEEPYRALLRTVKFKLKVTRAWARDNFVVDTPAEKPIYFYTEELLEPLLLCYESLIDCNAGLIAQGHLLDIIRQIRCFGVNLVRMDIRQEASKHSNLMSVITDKLGLGKYEEWDEPKRQEFLLQELENARPLFTHDQLNEATVQDTLQTFKLLSNLPRESLGSYVISMANEPSDVLLVLLLQREFGVKNYLPVVPLFETQSALQNSAKIIDRLLSINVYRKIINNYQQVMIGYSDSAKDVGMLAASWAQYCAQEEMVNVAKNYNIELVFFHGRGGSLGRGGWPTHQAILAQPPGTVNGVMRVTQQGEVIQTKFGLREIALRTFSVYTTSTLEASLLPPELPKAEWRALINDLARVSADHYRKVVAGDANFLRYFQAATPVEELKKLAIGSRPASRTNTDSLSKLRAIPWIFAWTQNRLILPSWLGVGEALQYAFDSGRGDLLSSMARDWSFFNTVLGMCEMVLAKVDTKMSEHYDMKLVPQDLLSMGIDFREQYAATRDILLQILEEKSLLIDNPVLERSINLRNRYLLPLHLLQVELLYRVRKQGTEASAELWQTLLVSIAGIAAGMRNTG